MNEKIIALVCERTGLSPDVATKAVDTVIGFLKENPDQIKELVGHIDAAEALSSVTKLFGR
jgi:hypothetical protein